MNAVAGSWRCWLDWPSGPLHLVVWDDFQWFAKQFSEFYIEKWSVIGGKDRVPEIDQILPVGCTARPIMSRCPYFQFLDGFNDALSRFRAIRAFILILQSSRDTMMFLFRHWSCLGGHADLRHCCFQHDSSEVPRPPVERAGFDQCTATRWYIDCRSYLYSFF